MDENFPKVGQNLRELRQDMNLTLDNASELTGVSKAMLGQIERGESSPTISTLWKISTGLKINFTTLINLNKSDFKIVKKSEVNFISEENGDMKLYPIFPYDAKSRMELFIIDLEIGCDYSSTTHKNVLEEYIVIIDGEVEVSIDGTVYSLEKDDSIKFDGSLEHSYKNVGNKKAVFHNIEIYR